MKEVDGVKREYFDIDLKFWMTFLMDEVKLVKQEQVKRRTKFGEKNCIVLSGLSVLVFRS